MEYFEIDGTIKVAEQIIKSNKKEKPEMKEQQQQKQNCAMSTHAIPTNILYYVFCMAVKVV